VRAVDLDSRFRDPAQGLGHRSDLSRDISEL
jgi:hypothetical protein